MAQTLILTDQGGEKVGRFGAAGVKRALMAPVRPTIDAKHKDFASVWCEEAEVYITRYGRGTRSYIIILTHWDSASEEAQLLEEEFAAPQRDKAIVKFLKLCKRNPLYADVSA